MKSPTLLSVLVGAIAVLAAFASWAGITWEGGPGPFTYTSIRGREVAIHGLGLYRHMSAEVAIQGIAQDWITLLVAVPALLVALVGVRRGSVRARVVLAGTVAYVLVTYLFYLAMGMYNPLFLVYAALLALAFFSLLLLLFDGGVDRLAARFGEGGPTRAAGVFLVANSLLVALLWLGIVVPPLLDGTVYPAALEHYTTLIVQGFDLGLLLPAGVVCGAMAAAGHRFGALLVTVYLVFLALMMAALSAKIAFMARAGVNVVPVVFIMPTVCALATAFAVAVLRRAPCAEAAADG